MLFSISDTVSRTLQTALDGLSMRQRVSADNIANIDTPSYRASAVDFESSLRAAVADGHPEETQLDVTATDTPVGANGNNVDLRKETMAAMQSLYQYQMMTRAYSDRASRLSTVAGA